MDGSNGTDTVSYAFAAENTDPMAETNGVVVDLFAGTATGFNINDQLSNIENIVGSDYDDILSGGSAVTGVQIDGGAGDDVLSGTLGDDVLWGGSGNDIFRGFLGNDIMHGGDGDDIFTSNLGGNAGNHTQYGDAGNDSFSWAGNNSGHSGSLTIHGGEGEDTVSVSATGTMGNIQYYADHFIANGITSTYDGIEHFTFNTPTLSVIAGAGDDVISLSGANTLDVSGVTGQYTSALNSLTLDSGAGVDTFKFTAAQVGSSVSPHVANFSLVDDSIDLTQVISNTSQYQLVQNGANTNLQVDLLDGHGFQTLVILDQIVPDQIDHSHIIV